MSAWHNIEPNHDRKANAQTSRTNSSCLSIPVPSLTYTISKTPFRLHRSVMYQNHSMNLDVCEHVCVNPATASFLQQNHVRQLGTERQVCNLVGGHLHCRLLVQTNVVSIGY